MIESVRVEFNKIERSKDCASQPVAHNPNQKFQNDMKIATNMKNYSALRYEI